MAEIDGFSRALGELAAEIRRQNDALLSHIRDDDKIQGELRACVHSLSDHVGEMRRMLLGEGADGGLAGDMREIKNWLIGGRAGARALRWIAALVVGVVTLTYMTAEIFHLWRHP